MQYNININQVAFVKLGQEMDIKFDLKHASLFDYIRNFANARRCKKRFFDHDPEEIYFKIDYKVIIEENPLLGFTNVKSVQRKLNDLCKAGIFKKHVFRNNLIYIRFDDNYDRIVEYKESNFKPKKESKKPKRGSDKNVQGVGQKCPGGRTKMSTLIKGHYTGHYTGHRGGSKNDQFGGLTREDYLANNPDANDLPKLEIKVSNVIQMYRRLKGNIAKEKFYIGFSLNGTTKIKIALDNHIKKFEPDFYELITQKVNALQPDSTSRTR